ncbi:bifunctional aminoglycoside phosphotransferase/ATP-binding protein [Leisingera caerulea]|uniref:bifunctional aminoglycoside phosphotransferase/ATP-binding protein n=1 Tax=Leisingera caerulea TaxID=506591 RepID=UPI0021A3C3C6|nr:bifunctional aminoglycoside phosphotransferase/ATP-binding protein [Leisingera caerulea]UWQ85690.1 AAA family ATPase [Leisingera caerulea]
MHPGETQQAEAVAFLSSPSAYGSDGPVEVVTTHSAHVFLTGGLAFKIKRAVRYSYLDFSSLDSRKAVLERELALNAPAAPEIYDRVVAVTRDASGGLALDGAGAPVEYVLRMHRFPREAELSRIADAGGLTVDLAARLGSAVAAYHADAERRGADGAVLIREIIDELREAFDGMEPVLGRGRVAAFLDRTEQVFAQAAPRLTERSDAGYVRRCHGDLHLRNLVMINGRPVPFDALEFDERLGTCDVFYDFGFLLMDLLHRGAAAQANAALNSYLQAAGDYGGLAALPLFMALRAAIRAMVTVQGMAGSGSDEAAGDARNYLDLAADCLAAAPPRLVAVGGLSGTGKTTVAARVAPLLRPAPGAVHLRSDVERKALFGAAPLDRLPAEGYGPDVTAKVYARLLDLAEQALRAGHSVIVDATFLEAGYRKQALALAARLGVPFDGIWLHADPAVLEQRIAARTGDASDADADVLHAQLKRSADPAGWTRIACGGEAGQVAGLVQDTLFPA